MWVGKGLDEKNVSGRLVWQHEGEALGGVRHWIWRDDRTVTTNQDGGQEGFSSTGGRTHFPGST